MIYSDDFVWLHFPKCAGTKIEKIFERYFSDVPGLHQDVVNVEIDPTVSWHDNIEQRVERDIRFQLRDRAIVCCIRTLPSWLISRYNFEVDRSPELDHKPELLLEGKFLEQSGNLSHADYYMQSFLPPTILNGCQVQLIRVESFQKDFCSIFGNYLDVSRIPEKEFSSKENKSKQHVPEVIREQLHAQSKIVYEHCPYWREVEARVYESLAESRKGLSGYLRRLFGR